MRNVRLVILIVLSLTFSVVGNGQKVSATKKVLSDVPEPARGTLTSRLQSYIKAFNNRDISSMFDLVSDRAKRGMTREEFLQKVTTDPQEIYTYSFKILRVRKGAYVDEPVPKAGEGEKWSVSGCQKVSVRGARAKRYSGGFDVWLVDGKWYVRRSGLLLEDGGYQECKD